MSLTDMAPFFHSPQDNSATAWRPYRRWAYDAPAIITTSTAANTADEPMVPKSSPPFSWGLVRKSPRVAPNGRVSTNATQNNSTEEIWVKYLSATTTAMAEPISKAPPAKPNPESSARKSPNAVPKVLENRIAIQ